MNGRGTYRRKVKTVVPTEFSEQIKLCVALDKLGLLYYAVPNGGKRSYLEAINFKRGGVKAGVPDICVAEARSPYHGLYIELKRLKGGRVSEEQQHWIDALQARGYRAEVCKGAAEAMAVIEDYLKC